MLKTYYRVNENIELIEYGGRKRTAYEVIRVNEDAITKEYNLKGTITVPTDELGYIERYNYETDGYVVLEDQLKHYKIIDYHIIPTKIRRLIEYYFGNIEKYNETEDNIIDEKEIDEFIRDINRYELKEDDLYADKVANLWEGSNFEEIIVESEYLDVEWIEDDKAFLNLKELDREILDNGYEYILLTNNYNTYVKEISPWGKDNKEVYIELNDMGIEKLREI